MDNRIWKPIEFKEIWYESDTSILDDISASWFKRRAILKENSGEYAEFLIRLKREHAIETGVVERLYDLDRGITETFIKEGFVKSYLSHGDTDISENDLMNHLGDHLDSVNFIFDVVKEERPLTTGFIKELHHLVTRSQKYTEGRDQFGNNLKIELLKGTYKVRENNPTRDDGSKVLYCPPEHVASEMDKLVEIYNDLVKDKVHALIIATWFHHAFTIIHPFQDGNGRVARLLASLIFIKYGYFPITVLREEAKVRYIDALEKADKGNAQDLVNYFGEIQKRNIQKALNLKEIVGTSFEEIQQIFVKKVENWKEKREEEYQLLLRNNRMDVFLYCNSILNELKDKLELQLNGNAEILIASCSFNNPKNQHYFYRQIVRYAKKHDYFFNSSFPKSWLTFRINLSETRKYQLGLSIHHYGYDDTTLAIGSFLEFMTSEEDDRLDTTLPLDILPHVISIDDIIDGKKKNIRNYIENALTLTLAQIANEIN